MSKFLVGSRAFFSCYPDFNSKDEDWIHFIPMGSIDVEYRYLKLFTREGEKCIFQYQDRPKREIIKLLKQQKDLSVVMLLQPQVIEYLQVTIDDIKDPEITALIQAVAPRYQYYDFIRKFYIENNSFTLTSEQRDKIYKVYNAARQ